MPLHYQWHYITTTTPQLQQPLIWTTATITIGQRQWVDDGLENHLCLEPYKVCFYFLYLLNYISRLRVQMEMKTTNSQTGTKTISKRQGRGRDSRVGKGSRHALHVLSPLVCFFFYSYFFYFKPFFFFQLDYHNVDECLPPLPNTITRTKVGLRHVCILSSGMLKFFFFWFIHWYYI